MSTFGPQGYGNYGSSYGRGGSSRSRGAIAREASKGEKAKEAADSGGDSGGGGGDGGGDDGHPVDTGPFENERDAFEAGSDALSMLAEDAQSGQQYPQNQQQQQQRQRRQRRQKSRRIKRSSKYYHGKSRGKSSSSKTGRRSSGSTYRATGSTTYSFKPKSSETHSFSPSSETHSFSGVLGNILSGVWGLAWGTVWGTVTRLAGWAGTVGGGLGSALGLWGGLGPFGVLVDYSYGGYGDFGGRRSRGTHRMTSSSSSTSDSSSGRSRSDSGSSGSDSGSSGGSSGGGGYEPEYEYDDIEGNGLGRFSSMRPSQSSAWAIPSPYGAPYGGSFWGAAQGAGYGAALDTARKLELLQLQIAQEADPDKKEKLMAKMQELTSKLQGQNVKSKYAALKASDTAQKGTLDSMFAFLGQGNAEQGQMAVANAALTLGPDAVVGVQEYVAARKQNPDIIMRKLEKLKREYAQAKASGSLKRATKVYYRIRALEARLGQLGIGGFQDAAGPGVGLSFDSSTDIGLTGIPWKPLLIGAAVLGGVAIIAASSGGGKNGKGEGG